ncbi:MAG TPA: SRPBCC family protein [Luteitalea sp.]|nr:SRPBCC family protein [Luteitalea sp.]
MRTNLGRWERIGSVAAGAGLMYLASRRPGLRRSGQVLGAGLVARGVSGRCAVKRALVGDRDTSSDTRRALGGSSGLHVRESIIVSRPAEEVYRFWRNYDNLSRFLEHVERVDDLGGGRSHWVVRGPANTTYEWDAEIINDEPGERLAWKSVGDADVVSAGSVVFRRLGSEQTQIAVHFQYAPPGGALGRGLAAMLGQDPTTQVRDDLARLRFILEARTDAAGAIPAATTAEGGHQPW